ncbi:MAG: PAS domain S-box protein [bacterium]
MDDSEDTILLLVRELRKAGYEPDYTRIGTPDDLHTALSQQTWDIIIADDTMHEFICLEALRMAHCMRPDIPFILIAGGWDQDRAADLIEAGAFDYIVKDHPLRFILSVEHAREEVRVRRELNKTRASLQEMKDGYQNLVEHIPAIAYTAALDAPSSSLYVSPHIEKILGFTPEEFTRDPEAWLKQIHPEDRKRVMAEITKADKKGRPFICEYRMLTKDGRVVWFRDKAATAAAGENKSSVRQGIMIDITARKIAEEALQKASAKLEKRVEQRTRALRSANESLQREIEEGKRKETALTESEERFRALVQNALDVTMIMEVDGIIKYISPSVETILGFIPRELIGSNVCDYIHPDDTGSARALLDTLLADRGHIRIPSLRTRRSDGAWIHMEGIATNLLGNPAVKGIVVNARDVTERKKADNEREHFIQQLEALALKAQTHAQELDAVIASLSHPVMIYDTHGTVVNANSACIDGLGFDPKGMDQAAVLQEVYSRLSTGERTMVEQTVSASALHGETVKGQRYVFTTPSGEERAALCSASPIRTGDRIIGAVVLWEDITDRVRMDEALKQSHEELEIKVAQRTAELLEANRRLEKEIAERMKIEREIQAGKEILERVFSNTHILIAYMDDRFNFIRVNRAYAEADGRTPEFYPGKNHFQLFPNEENERIFRQVILTGEPYMTYAKPFVYQEHPERGVTYWDWSLQPVKNARGKVEGLMLFLVNVTKRKQAEEQIAAMQKELIQAQHLSDIGTLASTVAHELRNPLAVIETACFNIRHKNRDPSLEKNLRNIEECLVESEQIIDNLLYYSRMRTPDYKTISLLPLLEECLEAVKKRERKRRVSILKRCRCLEDLDMEADPTQLKEVFTNILNNACDALKEDGGKIVVEADADSGGFIRILFTDNGAGITEENLKNICKPFFSTKTKGTGLGLTVCRQIVDLHRGTMEISSEPGRGTTIGVVLPLRRRSD